MEEILKEALQECATDWCAGTHIEGNAKPVKLMAYLEYNSTNIHKELAAKLAEKGYTLYQP